MAQTVLDNIHKININNILTGHSEMNPESFTEDITGEKPVKGHFEKNENFFDDENGGWRISDYGADKLTEAAHDLYQAKTPEEKLQIIDRILNVVHARSDLSSWFVEGGKDTLNNLAGKAEGLKTELRLPKVENLRVPPERTTGEYDTPIKQGGAIPGGIQKGDPEIDLPDLALFHDPATGSTLALPVNKVSVETVKPAVAEVQGYVSGRGRP